MLIKRDAPANYSAQHTNTKQFTNNVKVSQDHFFCGKTSQPPKTDLPVDPIISLNNAIEAVYERIANVQLLTGPLTPKQKISFIGGENV